MLNIDINKLKDIEVEIYKYILKNRDKVIYMTIRELASEVHVSTSTILRFCKIIGCSGFSEFKSLLKLTNERSDDNGVIEDNTLEEFYERTLQTNLHDKIDSVAEVVSKYTNVIFVGTGASKFIAEFGANYLSNFGKLSFCLQNDFYPLTSVKLEDHICIALSVSGETLSVLRMVKLLRNQGVPIVSITNSKTSTLAKLSDYKVCYYISKDSRYDEDEKGLSYRDLTSQVPTLYILERMSRQVGRLKQDVTDL
ncbi:MAG: MurR/RpiR family transcriptional regulator [Clostridium sp.]